jgi:hypothetical protein
MSRKPHRTPYGDVILTIYNKYVKPALWKLAGGEDETSLDQGLRRFFHVDTRHIYFAKAKRPFKIPGKMWIGEVPLVMRVSAGRRYVKRGEGMVVRIDDTMPDRVDIEFDDQVFSMRGWQWKAIKEFVELVA